MGMDNSRGEKYEVEMTAERDTGEEIIKEEDLEERIEKR